MKLHPAVLCLPTTRNFPFILILQVLDLESNSVRDAEQAIQLGTCPRLWSLTLTANPLCRDRHYRRAIIEAVPQLASLDEENVTGVLAMVMHGLVLSS